MAAPLPVSTANGPSTGHETRVTPTPASLAPPVEGFPYVAECTLCAWRGPGRRSWLAALLDGDSHEESVSAAAAS